jgi:hypothetical protein
MMLQQIFHDKCFFMKQAVAIDTHLLLYLLKTLKHIFYVFLFSCENAENNLQCYFVPVNPNIQGISRVIRSPTELKMQPTIHVHICV